MTGTTLTENSLPQNSGHPKGLFVLFTTEMWERFSYYGMRAILTLFLTKALFFSKGESSIIYGQFTGLVYLTPLLGGYIADRYWGNRRSIIVGGLLMALGQFCMFFSAINAPDLNTTEGLALSKSLLYIALGLLILGNGFFKPNISTMVGSLYPKQDSRIDSAYTIFYMGINVGAFIAPLLISPLSESWFVTMAPNGKDIARYSFEYGFLAAGIGMVLSLIIFIYLKNKYVVGPDGGQLGLAPKRYVSNNPDETPAVVAKFSTISLVVHGVLLVGLFFFFKDIAGDGKDIIGPAIYAACIAFPSFILTDSSLTSQEKWRIVVIYVLAIFVIAFWLAFEQAGASLTYFADEQTDRELFGWMVPASMFQSINPVAIVIFAPLFTVLWRGLQRKKREPSIPLKMVLGLFVLSMGYLVIAYAVNGVDAGEKTNMIWLVLMYAIFTLAELCISPIGLSMVNKLSPARFASLLMGVWFLSTATANYLSGVFSALYPAGPGEIKKAAKIGISNLDQMLAGKVVPTADQVAKLKEAEIPFEYSSLLGIQIDNLFSFFMIFAIMAAGSAILLLLIHKILERLMGGVR